MGRLVPSLGTGAEWRLEFHLLLQDSLVDDYRLAGQVCCLSLPPVWLLPHTVSTLSLTSLLSLGLSVCLSSRQSVRAYHSRERQRKSRRRAGQRSSSMAEAWPLPMVSSFCRLARSTCQDGQGSGPGLPRDLLPA